MLPLLEARGLLREVKGLEVSVVEIWVGLSVLERMHRLLLMLLVFPWVPLLPSLILLVAGSALAHHGFF